MENVIFFIGLFAGFLFFSFIPQIIFIAWDNNLNSPKRLEMKKRELKAAENLQQNKVERQK